MEVSSSHQPCAWEMNQVGSWNVKKLFFPRTPFQNFRMKTNLTKLPKFFTFCVAECEYPIRCLIYSQFRPKNEYFICQSEKTGLTWKFCNHIYLFLFHYEVPLTYGKVKFVGWDGEVPSENIEIKGFWIADFGNCIRFLTRSWFQHLKF